MNHRKSGRKFSRTSAHRKAMMRNLAVALISHEQIQTTLHKAKELRGFVEPMISRSAKNDLATRRYLISKLRDKEAINKLLNVLGPKFEQRPGGYIRVLKSGFRAGDNAPMALISLVDEDFKPKKDKKKQGLASELVVGANKLKKTVVEEAQDVASDIADAIDTTTGEVKELVSEAKAKIETGVEKAAEAVDKVKEEAIDEAKDIVSDLKVKVEAVVGKVKETAEDVKEAVTEEVPKNKSDAKKDTDAPADEKPTE